MVETVNRLLDALGRFWRFLGSQQAGMLQYQTHPINRLDDAIMQIHADAVAFFEDCQTAGIIVKAGILNCQPCPTTNGSDHLYIMIIERGGAARNRAKHPHQISTGRKRKTGHLFKASIHHRIAQITHVMRQVMTDSRLTAFCHEADHAFAV